MSTLGTAARTTAGVVLDRVYAPNQVPDEPTYPYLELSVGEYLPLAYSLDYAHGVQDFQMVLRVFGRTEDSTSDYMHTALDLFVDAYVDAYGPGRMELRPQAPTRDPDDNGVLSAIATLNFAKEKS